MDHIPYEAQIIGIEKDGWPLEKFTHPERAIYLLGAEDYGLPKEIIDRCQKTINVLTPKDISLNVATAGSIVMYDRNLKKGAWL